MQSPLARFATPLPQRLFPRAIAVAGIMAMVALIALHVLVATESTCAAADAAIEPDAEAIKAAAQRTSERLKTTAASWTALLASGANREIRLDILQTPARKRITMSVIDDAGRRVEVERIIERDELWYVNEQGSKPGKYRAGEYPFQLASVPLFIARAAIHPVVFGKRADLGTFQSNADGIALYQAPLPPDARQRIQSAIHQFEEAGRKDPPLLQEPEMQRKYQSLKQTLADGVPLRIEIADGFIAETWSKDSLKVKISNFHWVEKVDDSEFSFEHTAWEDRSSDPTAVTPAARQDWVMIAHTLVVDPANGKGDADGRLLDLATGRMRRIPFNGEISIPGCFLKNRDKVVVTGMTQGQMGLYEIDLKSRANRQLAADALAGGFPLSPVLSPDGKTLAVGSTNLARGFDHTQVCLIDVESGQGRAIGEPLDTAYLSWTPDGAGLILVSRQTLAMEKPPLSTVCRMDLNGHLTPLLTGNSPVVLHDGRIMFREDSEDGRTWKWNTCDIDGKNVKLLGDGLSKFSFAAPAPDGERMLMMHYVPGRGATPYVFRIGQVPGEPAVQTGGFWMSPQWR